MRANHAHRDRPGGGRRQALPPTRPSRTYETSELGTRRSFGHVLNDTHTTLVRAAPKPSPHPGPPEPTKRQSSALDAPSATSSTISTDSSSPPSRTSTTRSVLSRPSGIVSPALQFGTAVLSVGGSARVPSSRSRRKVNAPIGPLSESTGTDGRAKAHTRSAFR